MRCNCIIAAAPLTGRAPVRVPPVFYQGRKNMKKTIEIGETPMEFEAVATTDYMVEAVFGLRMQQALNNSKEGEYADLVQKLAFIMNRRAALGSWKLVNQLTTDDFMDWLDSIDSYALIQESTAKEIMSLYAGSKQTKVIPKNTNSPQAGS